MFGRTLVTKQTVGFYGHETFLEMCVSFKKVFVVIYLSRLLHIGPDVYTVAHRSTFSL